MSDPGFLRVVEAQTVSGIMPGNRVELLHNGDQIFPAMLTAIRGARRTVTFATFIYEEGTVARELTEAFAERCRAGVGVNVLVDSFGSRNMPTDYTRLMREAGCHVAEYESLSPFAVRRLNRRNHRRILVVDGRVGFTGGTGVGRKWEGNGRRTTTGSILTCGWMVRSSGSCIGLRVELAGHHRPCSPVTRTSRPVAAGYTFAQS